jgi:hypothetical protein
MLAQGDPIAKELFDRYGKVTMPNLRLAKEDVAVIVEYLAAQAPRGTASHAERRHAAAVIGRK